MFDKIQASGSRVFFAGNTFNYDLISLIDIRFIQDICFFLNEFLQFVVNNAAVNIGVRIVS